MRTMRLVPVVVGLAVLSLAAGRQAPAEDDFERPPISYSATTPDNPIERPGDVVRSVYPDAPANPCFQPAPTGSITRLGTTSGGGAGM